MYHFRRYNPATGGPGSGALRSIFRVVVPRNSFGTTRTGRLTQPARPCALCSRSLCGRARAEAGLGAEAPPCGQGGLENEGLSTPLRGLALHAQGTHSDHVNDTGVVPWLIFGSRLERPSSVHQQRRASSPPLAYDVAVGPPSCHQRAQYPRDAGLFRHVTRPRTAAADEVTSSPMQLWGQPYNDTTSPQLSRLCPKICSTFRQS